MKQEMSRISDQATDPKYKIYVLVKLPLRSFITKLRREIGAAEPREDKTSGLMTVKTSLKGFGRLMDQFDPGTPMQAMPAQLLAAVGLPPEKSGPQSSRIKMGFREDMYEIIKHAIERKHHVDCNVTFVDNYGNIYYEQREVDYSIADEDDNEY
jgi:hypothetical protein